MEGERKWVDFRWVEKGSGQHPKRETSIYTNMQKLWDGKEYVILKEQRRPKDIESKLGRQGQLDQKLNCKNLDKYVKEFLARMIKEKRKGY